jgi:hypothetical protein
MFPGIGSANLLKVCLKQQVPANFIASGLPEVLAGDLNRVIGSTNGFDGFSLPFTGRGPCVNDLPFPWASN